MKKTTETKSEATIQKPKYERIDWDKADDETVIAAILDRDNGVRSDRAWRELFKRYDATINKRLRSVIGNCSRAFRSSDTFEEIRAEIIASLLWNDMRKLRAFDPKKGTLGALLSKITHHAAIDYLTKLVNGGVPDPYEALEADDCDAGYGEEDRDSLGDGQIGARWLGGVSMSSPQRLVTILQAASVSVIDEKRLVVFAWFGGDHVHVFDQDGDEVHRFAVKNDSEEDVQDAIERMRTSTKLDRLLGRE